MTIKNEKLRKAFYGSFYTITGAGGDLNDWKEGYSSIMREKGIGAISEWIAFTGKEMNEEFGLTGTNTYPDDLHFLAFPIDGLDIGKLAIFKLSMGDRWFDDIVINDLGRERR